METAKVDVKPGCRVHITAVGGDLRLTGSESRRLEAQAGRRGGLRLKAHEDVVELASAGGCLVFLPSDCEVRVGSVGGDGRITDVVGAVSVETVGGDLRLRRLRQVEVGVVGGDVLGQRLRGRVRLSTIGGDAMLDRVEGDVDLGNVSGDLRVRSLTGGIEARVKGDVDLELTPSPSGSSSVRAGGDLTCRLPSEASIEVRLHAGGSLRVDLDGVRKVDGDDTVVTLGGGEARLHLSARGDVALQGGGAAGSSDLAESITAQVEAALEQAGASIDSAPGEDSFYSRDVGHQVRRALDRVLRPAAGARGPVATGVGDDLAAERAMILKMLAEGKVTAVEAEALFRAVEGEG